MITYAICFLIGIFVFARLTCGWCYSKVCLVGKTALITGGNSGIGYQAALALASRGCRVIIADKDDATESVQKIIHETNNPNVVAKHLDLSSFASVRKFAKEIIATESKLDILMNNAGIGSTSINYTNDGLQRTMQVNYFGHFLLTHLLMDLLKKSSPSRIIFTSSLMGFVSKLNVEDLNPPKDYFNLGVTYNNSKLCLAAAAKSFAEKLKGTGVTAYSFHPGAVRTSIFLTAFKEDNSIWIILFWLVLYPFGKSAEEGAQTLIHLATDKEVERHSGKLFVDCRPFVYPYKIYDDKFCQDVWQRSVEYVNLDPSECLI